MLFTFSKERSPFPWLDSILFSTETLRFLKDAERKGKSSHRVGLTAAAAKGCLWRALGSGCQDSGVHQGCGLLGHADLSSPVCSPTGCQGLCHLVGAPQSFWAAADGRAGSFCHPGSPTSDRDVWLVGNQRIRSHPRGERLHTLFLDFVSNWQVLPRMCLRKTI